MENVYETLLPFGIDEMFAAFSRVISPMQMDLSELINANHSTTGDVWRLLFWIVSRQIVSRCLLKTKKEERNLKLNKKLNRHVTYVCYVIFISAWWRNANRCVRCWSTPYRQWTHSCGIWNSDKLFGQLNLDGCQLEIAACRRTLGI